ncbi:hypothetical protein CON65_09720 [Bacillus pseudomycoides]|uniref:Accessory regulator AgrC n=1 Tax=Bacillus pseudomycoides TaxID=64104 RepID=A0AA91VD74_9BACI|nr:MULTISPECIES: hypothetical protein [Bacillus]PEB47462.1 hypothetical protein COO03_26170 [Bacillus sp. AFS098217]PED82806.1 hypothetical protein CON65_09720 [Bacillus pseudomycoides]PEU10352.1 hypothetical protein CN525_23615 [Bacillus sp. AFS014408]PEU13316.1 hypothetical protein CN524_11660 [Bacillus sp. AFS019443]PFW62938.1 hypothetical protein COL20_10735 [Bacillus sp. AFS075034]
MIPVICITATILSFIFAIIFRHKYPGYSILTVFIVPAASFYTLGKFQYTEVFIGFAIAFSVFTYILTMKRISTNQ